MDITRFRSSYPQYDDLSDEQVVDALHQRFYSDMPRDAVRQRLLGDQKPKSRNAFAVVNDFMIEAGNAVAGTAGAVADFVSPGNDFSEGVREFQREGESKQSDKTKAAKAELSASMDSDSLADNAAGVGRYVMQNPDLAAAQALGSFVGPGAAIKGGRAVAGGLKAGEKAVARTGLGAGAAAGGAMAGGDAAGSAYERVMSMDDDVILASPQARALQQQGMTDVSLIRETIAKDAGRDASIIPALIGTASGLVGAEKLFAGAGRATGGVLARTAKGAVTEAVPEFAEEAITQYEGNRAAQQVDPTIDASKGVAGAGFMGAALGGITGGTIGAITPARDLKAEADQQRADAFKKLAEARSVDEMIAATEEVVNRPRDDIAENTRAIGENTMIATGGEAVEADRLKRLQERIDANAEAVASGDTAAIEQSLTAFGGRPIEPQNFDPQPAVPAELAAREDMRAKQREAAGMPPRQDEAPEAAVAAPRWVDLTPLTNEQQARTQLAQLRERAPEFGANPNDMVLAPHPEQAGAFAVRLAPGRDPAPMAGVPAAPYQAGRVSQAEAATPANLAARKAMDRQAKLQGQANNSPTQFDRDSAAEQAATQRAALPRRDNSTAEQYPDGLQPLTMQQAKQRLAALGAPEGLQIVRHPSVKATKVAGGKREPAFVLQAKPQAPVVAPPAAPRAPFENVLPGGLLDTTEQRLKEAGARQPKTPVGQLMAERGQQRTLAADQIARNIEERGGVASPSEARVLADAGLGKPYDRIDPALDAPQTVDTALTEATGIDVTGTRNRVKDRRVYAEPQSESPDVGGPESPAATGERRGGEATPRSPLDAEYKPREGGQVLVSPRQEFAPPEASGSKPEAPKPPQQPEPTGEGETDAAPTPVSDGEFLSAMRVSDNEELKSAVQSKSMTRVVAALRKSKSPSVQRVAALAANLIGQAKFKAWPTSSELRRLRLDERRVMGFYRPFYDTIHIRPDMPEKGIKGSEQSEWVVAHEMVHALLSRVISNPNAQQRPFVVQLRALFNHVKRAMPGVKDYGLTDEHEFLSEALTNPEFQLKLSKIPYRQQSAWSRFVETLAKMLGMQSNALTEAISLTEKLARGKREKAKASQRDDVFAAEVAEEFDAPQPRDEPRSAAARERDDLTDEQRRALTNVTGAKRDVRAEFEKLRDEAGEKGVWKTLREYAKPMTQRLVQNLVDQYAPIKELDAKAYMLARLSAGADGTLEASMLYGKPYITSEGVADVELGEGFVQIMSKLGGETESFLMWIAAQRAAELKAAGRENLFAEQDIEALSKLDRGMMKDGRDRAQVYAEAAAEFAAFNAAAVNVAVKSGLLSQSLADYFKDHPYVPFYRDLAEDGGSPFSGSALTGQKFSKRLKGGTTVLRENLLENVLQNWSHLYTASAKNRAALATLEAAVEAGAAEAVEPRAKGSVSVMRNGEVQSFYVNDAPLAAALSSFEYVMPTFFKPFAEFKRLLTIGVTTLPDFKLKNLIRDSIQAIAISPLGANPFANVTQGLKELHVGQAFANLAKTAAGKTPESFRVESQTYASMLAGGGLIRFGAGSEGNRAANTNRMIRRATKSVLLDGKGARKLLGHMADTFAAYQELGDVSEQANRVALYKQLIAKGHSHAEASFMARDLLDFSMSGKAGVVRFLCQSVPFLNARLQGLYKLGRGAAEDKARFAAVTGAVALASLALMWAQEDDEDWKAREDWDRDAYWWFKIGDTAFRLPKPFEVGAIGTLAERTWELGFNEEMTGSRYWDRVKKMLSQTFAFDPMPQIAKPLQAVYANKDSFSGRDIETRGDERLLPEYRYDENTSELARLLGKAGIPEPVSFATGNSRDLSPQQIDFLLKGYFGTLGALALGLSDAALRPMADRGDRPSTTLKKATSSFLDELPADQSRYVQALYDRAEEVSQMQATYKSLLKTDREAAVAFFAENKALINQHKQTEKAKRQLTQVNKQIQVIEASKELNATSKREALTRLRQQRNDIAKRVEQRLPAL